MKLKLFFALALSAAAACAQSSSVSIGAPIFSGSGLNDVSSGGRFISAPASHKYSVTAANPYASWVSATTAGTPATPTPGPGGYAGIEFTVGASNVTLTALGRYCVAGNSANHLLYLENSAPTVLAKIVISMANCASGQYVYASMNPVVLTAGATYSLMSAEQGSDQFLSDDTTVSVTGVATLLGSYYTTGINPPTPPFGFTLHSSAPHAYIPVSFLYSTSSATTTNLFMMAKDDNTVPGATVAMTGAAQAIGDGVTITFPTATGYTVGSTWTIYATANGTMTSETWAQSGMLSTLRNAQDKVREVVSVTDFGADPSGVKDSTAAFNAAIGAVRKGSTCGTVNVPTGIFHVSSSWVAGGCQGLHLQGAGDASQIEWMGDSVSPVLYLLGCYRCTVDHMQLHFNSAHPAIEAIEVSTGAPNGTTWPFSSRLDFHDMLIDGAAAANLKYCIMVDGFNANNDFHRFHDSTCQHYGDTGVWLKGGQSFSHSFDNFFITAFGEAPYGVKATPIDGDPTIQAAGFAWHGGGVNGTTLWDFYIHGYTPGAGYLIENIDDETQGGFLHVDGQITGNTVVRGPSRWIQESPTLSTPTIIEYGGCELEMSDFFARNESPTAMSDDHIQIKYNAAGVCNHALVVNNVEFVNLNQTVSSLFATGTDTMGTWFQPTNFHWQDPSGVPSGIYTLGAILPPPLVISIPSASETTVMTATDGSSSSGNGAELRAYASSGPETFFHFGQRVGSTTTDFSYLSLYTGGLSNAGARFWLKPGPFAGAPTCDSAHEGSMYAVTDSNQTVFGGFISGGSTNHVLAYCDGSHWTVMGN